MSNFKRRIPAFSCDSCKYSMETINPKNKSKCINKKSTEFNSILFRNQTACPLFSQFGDGTAARRFEFDNNDMSRNKYYLFDIQEEKVKYITKSQKWKSYPNHKPTHIMYGYETDLECSKSKDIVIGNVYCCTNDKHFVCTDFNLL